MIYLIVYAGMFAVSLVIAVGYDIYNNDYDGPNLVACLLAGLLWPITLLIFVGALIGLHLRDNK